MSRSPIHGRSLESSSAASWKPGRDVFGGNFSRIARLHSLRPKPARPSYAIADTDEARDPFPRRRVVLWMSAHRATAQNVDLTDTATRTTGPSKYGAHIAIGRAPVRFRPQRPLGARIEAD